MGFIKEEPTKVLLIFDGLDEYSREEDIKALEDDLTYKNSVEEKMPVSVLYNKLAEGKLFSGASILTTTRSTAVNCSSCTFSKNSRNSRIHVG